MFKQQADKLISLQNQKKRHPNLNFQLGNLKIQIENHKLSFLIIKLKISNFWILNKMRENQTTLQI